MNRIWKWILGILAVLIVVGLVAGAVLMWRNGGMYGTARSFRDLDRKGPWAQQAPGSPDGFEGYRGYHMRGWGGHMPMMGYGYRPFAYGPMGPGFMFFGGLFHLLLPLGVLALVAYVFYGMGKRAGMSSNSASGSGSLPDVDSLPRRKVARS